MIERVATRLYDLDREEVRRACGRIDGPLSERSPGVRQRYLLRAREVIAAMRKPTEDMEVEATEKWLCVEAMEDRAKTIWQAMIDAALKEG